MRELRSARPEIQGDEPSDATAALFKAHEHNVRRVLDPVWHTLSAVVKQHVTDLRTLRLLMEYINQYDAVSFLQFLEILKISDYAFNKHSHWLFLSDTDNLFLNARRRVYKPGPVRESLEFVCMFVFVHLFNPPFFYRTGICPQASSNSRRTPNGRPSK